MRSSKPRLSVVVVFYDMVREAKRTLYSLTPSYQRGVAQADYEVIAIDNGSSQPLGEDGVSAIDGTFRYAYRPTDSMSPAGAINYGVQMARADIVTCLIDGARILSPRVLDFSLRALDVFSNPFVYTLSMHLGPDVQNRSMLEGYDQEREDELLESVDWKSDGYELFRISSLAGANKKGYFSRSNESNAVTMRRVDFVRLGGYDERFESPGGGMVNLDLFNRIQADETLEPVMILGEATFHQFHGGVATNTPPDQHPWKEFTMEYEHIKGRPYKPVWRRPQYIGHLPPASEDALRQVGLSA